MTVRELIEKLKAANPKGLDADVWICDEHGDETEIVDVDVIGGSLVDVHVRILEGKVWR